jgi:hypothetical protein
MSSAITFNKVHRVLSVVWICAQTVRTSLNASGLHVRKQALRTTIIHVRLICESGFCLDFHDGRIRVW